MFIQKLNNSDLENITGGQLMAENVMGVLGLTAVTGSPTDTNPDGIFWDKYGIALTKNEAMDTLKTSATRTLSLAEEFLREHIDTYNDKINGYST